MMTVMQERRRLTLDNECGDGRCRVSDAIERVTLERSRVTSLNTGDC